MDFDRGKFLVKTAQEAEQDGGYQLKDALDLYTDATQLFIQLVSFLNFYCIFP